MAQGDKLLSTVLDTLNHAGPLPSLGEAGWIGEPMTAIAGEKTFPAPLHAEQAPPVQC